MLNKMNISNLKDLICKHAAANNRIIIAMQQAPLNINTDVQMSQTETTNILPHSPTYQPMEPWPIEELEIPIGTRKIQSVQEEDQGPPGFVGFPLLSPTPAAIGWRPGQSTETQQGFTNEESWAMSLLSDPTEEPNPSEAATAAHDSPIQYVENTHEISMALGDISMQL